MQEPPPHHAAMIVLAYLWPLAIIPLLLDKDDADVQWHAKHGLVLMVAELILLLAFTMLTTIVSLATFGVGCVVSIFGIFIWVAIVALHVAAMIKGIGGTRLLVPRISDYADRF